MISFFSLHTLELKEHNFGSFLNGNGKNVPSKSAPKKRSFEKIAISHRRSLRPTVDLAVSHVVQTHGGTLTLKAETSERNIPGEIKHIKILMFNKSALFTGPAR